MSTKTISVVPTPETSKKIDDLKKQLRTSRAGFCEIALEFVVPKVLSGEMALVNGKLVFTKNQQAA